MKKALLISTLVCLGFACNAKSSPSSEKDEVKEVKSAITTYAYGGDKQDVSALDKALDANFRIVMNQLFGSKAVDIMPKEVYLQKIRAKEFGGDSRSLQFKHIEVNGNTACARVVFKGKQMSFESLILLVKNSEEKWLLVSEMPVILP